MSKVVGVETVLWKEGALGGLHRDYLSSGLPRHYRSTAPNACNGFRSLIPNRDQLSADQLREAMFHLNHKSSLQMLFLYYNFPLQTIFKKGLGSDSTRASVESLGNETQFGQLAVLFHRGPWTESRGGP